MSITSKKLGTLEYLTAEGIVAAHCFTTRLGGVSEGYLSSLNIGMHRGDEPENVAKNHALLANALGYDVKNIVMAHQSTRMSSAWSRNRTAWALTIICTRNVTAW